MVIVLYQLIHKSNGRFPTKTILISTICLTLKSFSCSMLAPGMPNVAFSVFFFCAENRFDHENPIVSNKYEKYKINKTIIVIIVI